MRLSVAQWALLAVLLASAAAALPAIREQARKLGQARQALGAKSLPERAAFADTPAVPLAREIASAVPETACVGILAYAGPAAVDYYRARLSYLLYPRRVEVAARTGASFPGCSFLAVFRDTQRNLAAEPFQGEWRAGELEDRTAEMELVNAGRLARIYRVR